MRLGETMVLDRALSLVKASSFYICIRCEGRPLGISILRRYLNGYSKTIDTNEKIDYVSSSECITKVIHIERSEF